MEIKGKEKNDPPKQVFGFYVSVQKWDMSPLLTLCFHAKVRYVSLAHILTDLASHMARPYFNGIEEIY